MENFWDGWTQEKIDKSFENFMKKINSLNDGDTMVISKNEETGEIEERIYTEDSKEVSDGDSD